MTKKDKLYARIKNSQSSVRFGDFQTLLAYFGFVLVRSRGSHHLYHHPSVSEVMSIQPKKDGSAKAYQIRQFLKLVAQYGMQLEDDDDA